MFGSAHVEKALLFMLLEELKKKTVCFKHFADVLQSRRSEYLLSWQEFCVVFLDPSIHTLG